MLAAELQQMTVAEVMERWPESVLVFNRRRMACPGCVMAPFMTVMEAAGSYDIAAAELASDLLTAVAPNDSRKGDIR